MFGSPIINIEVMLVHFDCFSGKLGSDCKPFYGSLSVFLGVNQESSALLINHFVVNRPSLALIINLCIEVHQYIFITNQVYWAILINLLNHVMTSHFDSESGSLALLVNHFDCESSPACLRSSGLFINVL